MERAPKRPEGSPSPAVVWNRLREMQILCGEYMGLLFISGVDGKYNIGSTKALNYVLSGLSGGEICQKIRDEFEDVSLWFPCDSPLPYFFCQAVLVISANGSFLHVGSSELFWKLMARIFQHDLCENCCLHVFARISSRKTSETYEH